MRAFFYLALLGLGLSITAHLATFCGIDPQQVFPAVWMLHVGIFVIWFPAIRLTNRRTTGLPKSAQQAARMQGAPAPLRMMVNPLFAYTLFNFFFTIFVLMSHGSPTARNGKFVLLDHGQVVRTLSESEYHRYRAYEVRAFSGHWILFYFVGMTMLYPAAENPKYLGAEAAEDASGL